MTAFDFEGSGMLRGVLLRRRGDNSFRAQSSVLRLPDDPLEESSVQLGGFAVVEVATDAEALEWARKIAVAFRSSQEVRKIMADSEQESLQK